MPSLHLHKWPGAANDEPHSTVNSNPWALRHNLAPHLCLLQYTPLHRTSAGVHCDILVEHYWRVNGIHNINVVNVVQDYIQVNIMYRLHECAVRLRALDTDDSRTPPPLLPRIRLSTQQLCLGILTMTKECICSCKLSISLSHFSMKVHVLSSIVMWWLHGPRATWYSPTLITSTLEWLHYLHSMHCFELYCSSLLALH